jgi:diaminohydroxyphosphoribosylaminopyrimidine deaminase/5-amino-6-(5-phosphoribosylamino)uracil reductase
LTPGRRRSSSTAFSVEDEGFMRRALALAEQGRGLTRPNPVVGAVVTRDGRVLGEGYHHRAGEPHAEVNALAAVAPGDARGATLYVNLEPCCHTGRTGPCTAAILAAGITRVVFGCRDPNPLVDGRGSGVLRRAGVRVDEGCLAAESVAANRAFACWVREGRPLVTLKAAATLDGFIAPASAAGRAPRAPAWITGPAARLAAHELRAAHDAVLVGSGTVLDDDPRLTVRGLGPGPGTDGPWRVVLDARLRTPLDARVLRGAAFTVIFTAAGAAPARVRALERAGAIVRPVPAPRGRLSLRHMLGQLAKLQLQSVLLEGGATVHGAFIAAGLVDRVALFFAPTLLGGGVPIAGGPGLRLSRALRLGPLATRAVGDDLLLTADVLRPAAGGRK